MFWFQLLCYWLQFWDLRLLIGFVLFTFQVLHAGKTNKNGYKALIVAEYSGVKVELAPNFEMGVTNKTPEYLKLNPIGKVEFRFLYIYMLDEIVV